VALWLRVNRRERVQNQQARLSKALMGYYQYFGLKLCWTSLRGAWPRLTA
jgi:hypothetical protein